MFGEVSNSCPKASGVVCVSGSGCSVSATEMQLNCDSVLAFGRINFRDREIHRADKRLSAPMNLCNINKIHYKLPTLWKHKFVLLHAFTEWQFGCLTNNFTRIGAVFLMVLRSRFSGGIHPGFGRSVLVYVCFPV